MRRLNIEQAEQDETQSAQDAVSAPLLNTTARTQTLVEEADVQVRQLQSATLTAKRPTRAVATHVQKQEVRNKRIVHSLYVALTNDNSRKTQLSVTFDNLANLLNAGLPTAQALRTAAQNASAGMQTCFNNMAVQIEAGTPIEQAFAMQEQYLPAVVVPVIANALREGTLATASRQLAPALRKLSEVEHGFDYSAFNPMLTLPLIFGAIILGLPLLVQNPFVYGAIVATFMVGSIGLWYAGNTMWRKEHRGRGASVASGRFHLNRWTTKGTQNRAYSSARWTRTFAALWECGVPISVALEASAQEARNGYYAQQLQQAAALTRQGMTLADSLTQTDMMPPFLLDAIRTGEITGNIGENMTSLAPTLEADARETAAKWMFGKTFGLAALVAFLLAVLALIVLYIRIQMMPPELRPKDGTPASTRPASPKETRGSGNAPQ